MRVLLDTCISPGARDDVRAAGHDVSWAGEWPRDPGDDELLAKAASEGRTLVTLDKDFGELAVVRDRRHCGIIRLVGFTSEAQGRTCVAALAKYERDLIEGALITIEPWRVRVRPAEPGGR